VDGVLLRQNIYEPQADCLVEAALQVGGARAAAEALSWDWVGRTDLDILTHAVGYECLDVATLKYLELFREACPEDLSDQRNEEVNYAVQEAISEMGFSFIPVTGNLESVARIKLNRAGYTPFLTLDYGGYGEAGTRPEILREATDRLNGTFVYIGDTWRDMAAAELAGIRFIGWETEKHRGELDDAWQVCSTADDLIGILADAAFS
jgi:phosphoglycolate phosphatase-like HAD superfamily hydrolase